MTVVASVSGTRIDCDSCGWHATSPDLSVALLRQAAGFVHRADADLCAECAEAERDGASEPALRASAA